MYQDVTAKDWEFEVGDHGKPKIALPKSKLSFNLSHSHDYVILALGQEHDIGVDIEYMGRKSDYIAIAQHYFSASEIEDISTLPPDKQKERFYDYWTLKEAYIKACGMGLSLSLDKFSFSINQNGGADIQISENLNDNDDEWKFLRFAPEPDYRAAVAVRCGAGAQLIIRNFETIPLKGHCEVSSN
jgi:4'-phosphopantetheinyl transferase